MAIVHGLYRIIENTNVYTEFVLLEVKVPIVFLGTVGFSLRRDGRYHSTIIGTPQQNPANRPPQESILLFFIHFIPIASQDPPMNATKEQFQGPGVYDT